MRALLAIAAALFGLVSGNGVGHSTLVIPCGAGVVVQADWYKPSGTPNGLVWLQHGYGGSKANVAELAGVIARNTGAVVVAPSISAVNRGDGCWLLGPQMEQAVARMFADRRALQTSASAAGAGTLPEAAVLAGHSAGGNLALTAAGYGAPVRAVVMFDGAAGSDDHGQQAADALAALGADGIPVLDVASEPHNACPNRQPWLYHDVRDSLVEARPGRFVGVYLTGGRHMDALGYSEWGAMLLCGWSAGENVAAAQQLGSDWIGSALSGTGDWQRVPDGNATAVALG